MFATYIQEEEPRETHHVSTFWLPLETPRHFASQRALAQVQGQAGLWCGGDYTRDIGSHEDAVCSAIEVARVLAPNSDRLRALTLAEEAPG